MPIDIFSRVRNGNLNITSRRNNMCNVGFRHKKKKVSLTINNVWNNQYSNKQIFDELIEKGKNQNVQYWIAFGYTGSGKTYTIFGLLRELLHAFKEQELLHITAFQIYKDKLYDMLLSNKIIKYWKTDTLYIDSITKQKVTNINNIIKKIKSNRAIAHTGMNKTSSRSHAIITIYTNSKKFILIDMAGQENGQTNVTNHPHSQKEGTSINLNMLALKDCINRYHKHDKFIPFRRCLLTLALKPMFINQNYTAFICSISITHNMYYQMDSLRFAAALYKTSDNPNLDKLYSNLLKDFTEYMNQNIDVSLNEHDMWRKMRYGNFKYCKRIRNILDKKMKYLLEFNKTYDKYELKLPEINT